ncbi:MAG TPA: hypothetical protein H9773_04470 [Candidatus Fournierella merdavium]|nr:hypothetical protein [Candidatus Fournierella merdavium]
MKIELTPQEVALLEAENIPFVSGQEYTEDAALDLLERVRDMEVSFAQGEDDETQRRYRQYAALGDKLFALIPED